MISKLSIYLFLGVFLCTFASCDDAVDEVETRMVVLKIESPNKDAQLIEGQQFDLQLDIIENNANARLTVLLNAAKILDKKGVSTNEKLTISPEQLKLGYNEIEVIIEGFDDTKHSELRNVIVFSKTQPEVFIPVVQKTYPHNANHYTQGYEFLGNRLFEGTGQKGQSKVAEINLNSGEPTRQVDNDASIFGEGITIMNGEIFQLTWQSQICYVYNLADFSKKKEFNYNGEGWGLANDGKVLYMSNGSSRIVVRDPKTFEEVRSFDVFSNSQEYRALNELEFVDGFLYANVYQENFIVKIDPKDGRVVGLIDGNDLTTEGRGSGDVLNGIAYNAVNKRWYITGKNWIKVFEVVLEKKSAG